MSETKQKFEKFLEEHKGMTPEMRKRMEELEKQTKEEREKNQQEIAKKREEIKKELSTKATEEDILSCYSVILSFIGAELSEASEKRILMFAKLLKGINKRVFYARLFDFFSSPTYGKIPEPSFFLKGTEEYQEMVDSGYMNEEMKNKVKSCKEILEAI